jgi:hypothetical protein
MNGLEALFHEEMLALYEKTKKECNYHADRFLQEVSENGGLMVAKERLSNDVPETALFKLWKLGRLDLWVESLALRNQFRALFAEEELANARKRLQYFDYQFEEDF